MRPAARSLVHLAGPWRPLGVALLLLMALAGLPGEPAPGRPPQDDPVPPAPPPAWAQAGAAPPAAGTPGGDAPRFDLLIRGGTVVDGTGRPRFRADVGVRGDRIAAVGDLSGATADVTLEAAGRIVAPGFINAHSHSYEFALRHPQGDADLLQGITTVIGGVDGRSPWPLGGFLAQLERQGTGPNHALFVGHGTVRALVLGRAPRRAGPDARARMARLVRQAMAEGALGLSSGLEYVPGRYADTTELIHLARAVAPYGGIYSTHMRSEGDRIEEALAEALCIGRAAGVAVNVSHFKVVHRRNWPKLPRLLTRAEAAARGGLPVVADVYPYRAPDYASALPLESAWRRYPPQDLVIRRTAVPGAAGRTLAQYARALGVSPAEAARRLLARDPGTVVTALLVSESHLETLLRWPHTIVSSDGGARPPSADPRTVRVHPRVYGAFPRVLARYVRERRVLSLEEAVHKATGKPAAFFGLRDRGVIRPGAYADLVVFDPRRVLDRATWVRPQAYPVGVEAVVVNGRLAVRDGRRVPGVLAGRVLRGGRDALVGNPRPAGRPGGAACGGG